MWTRGNNLKQLAPHRTSRGTRRQELSRMGKLQKQICRFILDHFDQNYAKDLGETWITAREVLTSPLSWRYGILLNKFNFAYELETRLQSDGFHPLFQGTPLPSLPGSLKCYIRKAPGRFPAQKHHFGRLKQYYLLNAASLLPVYALEARDGDTILDMCAAPGGKSVALLQIASPAHLHCNEYDNLRYRWLKQTLDSFIPPHVMDSVTTTDLDGRKIGHLQPEMFDKVLVDAPCSNDRSWLFSSDPQQAALRIAERKDLPVVQIQLLSSAIEALRPGGSLVYSTCTLSRAENCDVIAELLSTFNSILPVDLSEIASAVSREFSFAAGVRWTEYFMLDMAVKMV
ncbi:hypothetical protein NDU88_005008 [Pleurodeles waltl]|uniref:SAM-dependent MTase RsmB/NOP-type domain-containing protein n=1 Tax=Pleurodeles waltl TaxID=8319 RepID=A0AAV7NU40_PLEWA|nr:hypothetical protein NDU88_005008 [Pleurodeles waltl]